MSHFVQASSAGSFRQDLVRWRQLVTPGWLARLLAGESVEATPAGAFRLIEVASAAWSRFEQGHIPGAAYLDTGELETPPLFNKIDDAALLAVLLRHGIRHDTTVILYGRGALAAARAAHLMLYAGVADVRLLDGGLSAWSAAGLALQAGSASVVAADSFGAPFPGCPDYLVDMAGVRQLMHAQHASLVSIRTWREHAGLTSGYSYIAACGEIPGARWGRAGREGDVNSMSLYQQADTSMRAARQIDAMWRSAGIVAGRRTVFYCGTGWRASLAFF
ncbi:MAG: rhodanese-like domain-containing protein [Pseudomonadota bacterium]